MPLPVLPPKYYLDHFREFLEFLDTHYQSVIEAAQLRFIQDFRALSESAQCLYVRMINRKGNVFSRKAFFKYKEIDTIEEGLQELAQKDFMGSVGPGSERDVLQFLTKTELKKWFQHCGLEIKNTWSREQFQICGEVNLSILQLENLFCRQDLVLQLREAEMEYLLFLYFGRIQKSLNLYTLRDLGIRKSGTLKTQFKSRYATCEEAQAEYFFAKSLEQVRMLSEAELVAVIKRAQEFQKLKSSTQSLKNEVLFRIGELLLEENESLALQSWQESRHPEAREKTARHFFKQGRHDEAKAVLEEILESPRTDVELLFAEDFLARKFSKKRAGYLSEVLNNAQEITLSDVYFKKPEHGVQEYYRNLGYQSHFTENHLWLSLFGVMFWEELFDSEEATIHNPFERTPADLVGPDFYRNNKDALDAKIEILRSPVQAQLHILKIVTANYGRLNDIFQWNQNIAQILLEFTQKAAKKNLGHILRTMASNFEFHHSGFPDLIVEKDGEVKFIEVKAEGDALRANQLSRIRLLKEAGFEVDVLRVNWQVDPNQVYVVVDVETTGGSAVFHRVTEVAALKVQNGHVIEEFHTLVNPERPIPKNIIAITGITNEMVADAPTFSQIAEKLYQFFEGAIFVAHNARFDYGFIQRELSRANIDFVRPNICTVAGMRKAFPGLASYSLKNLTDHFGISLDQHHRALCDAKATVELLLMMKWQKEETKEQVVPIDLT